MPNQKLGNLSFNLEIVNTEGGIPLFIQILPAGQIIEGRDGRTFINPGNENLIAGFAKDKKDIPIDIAHASEVAKLGEEPGALGYVKSLEDRNGELWGMVEWTQNGTWLLKDKSYRYLSPALQHDQNDNLLGISSLGLTNHPNLKLTALNTTTQTPTPIESNIMPDLPVIATALGLNTTGTKEEIVKTIATLKEENKALQTSLNTLQAQQAEEETALLKRQAESIIEAAVKEGKLPPAQKDIFLSMCTTQEGLEKVQETLTNSPVLLPAEAESKKETGQGKTSLNTEEKAMANTMGVTEEAFIASQEQLKNKEGE